MFTMLSSKGKFVTLCNVKWLSTTKVVCLLEVFQKGTEKTYRKAVDLNALFKEFLNEGEPQMYFGFFSQRSHTQR